MIKITELKANKYYIIACRSTAKSRFFDNEKEIKLFEHLFSRFMLGVCKIKKILYTAKGYIMVIKTLSKRSILDAYKKLKSRSKKRKPGILSMDLWKIISEHFRYLGCSFVTIKNSRSGREGSLFCRKYERYSIEEEFLEQFSMLLEMGYVNLEQRKNEYALVKNYVYRKTEENNAEGLFYREEVKKELLVKQGYYLIL